MENDSESDLKEKEFEYHMPLGTFIVANITSVV